MKKRKFGWYTNGMEWHWKIVEKKLQNFSNILLNKKETMQTRWLFSFYFSWNFFFVFEKGTKQTKNAIFFFCIKIVLYFNSWHTEKFVFCIKLITWMIKLWQFSFHVCTKLTGNQDLPTQRHNATAAHRRWKTWGKNCAVYVRIHNCFSSESFYFFRHGQFLQRLATIAPFVNKIRHFAGTVSFYLNETAQQEPWTLTFVRCILDRQWIG